MKRYREVHSPERAARDARYRTQPAAGANRRCLNFYGHFRFGPEKERVPLLTALISGFSSWIRGLLGMR